MSSLLPRLSYYFCGVVLFAIGLAWISPRIAGWIALPAQETKADAIVLLGAGVYTPDVDLAMNLSMNSLQRAQRALDLYRRGMSSRIIVSGGVIPPSHISEAESLSLFLQSSGVAESTIILEDRSFDTESNAVEVLKLAKKRNFKSLLLVATSVQMRRAYWLFNKYNTEGIQLIPSSAASIERKYRFLDERMYLSGILLHESLGWMMNSLVPDAWRMKLNYFLRSLFS